MTDLRTRLVDELLTAGAREKLNAEWVIDVLLSLPGIAIVEVPQVPVGLLWPKTFTPNELTPREMRDFAAALLAAANAAKKQRSNNE